MASIKRNGFYNDPALGQAFENIAQMFGPPKAADAYAYARARATREEADRLATFFAKATAAGATPEEIDRYGIASGRFNPTQSFHKVNQDDATTRRGQDVVARTTLEKTGLEQTGAWNRNKYDVDARSGDVRFKTGADNVAAGERNTADNSRAIQQTQIQEYGNTQRKLLDPVAQGAVRFNSPAIREMFGVPETQSGNVELKPGDRNFTADGRTLDGPAKPLTKSEMEARILEGLPANEQRAAALATVPTDNIVGPNNEATIAFRPDTVGQRPAATPVAPSPNAFNYQTQDGRTGLAAQGSDGRVRDVMTQEELPAGASRRELTGGAAETSLGAGTQNVVDRKLMDIGLANQATDELLALVNSNEGSQGIVGQLRGNIQDITASGTALGKLLKIGSAENAKAAAENKFDPEVVAQLTNFDGSIPAIVIAENNVIAHMARLQSGDSRVSNDRFNQLKAAVGSGWLGNADKTRAVLGQFKQSLAGQVEFLKGNASDPRLVPQISGVPERGQVNGPTGQGARPVVKMIRDANGKLVRAQ